MTVAATLRTRRLTVLGGLVAAIAVSWLALGHRGEHIARGLLFPGAGLIDERPVLAAACIAATVAATIAWLRWGADWMVATMLVVSVALSGLAVSAAPHALGHLVDQWPTVPAAHEFPLVIVVVALLTWLRSLTLRIPFVARLAAARHRRSDGLADVGRLSPTDRSRTAAILALAGDEHLDRACAIAADPEVIERARRVGAVARFRLGPDPLRRDHAHARAALVLADPTSRWPPDATAAHRDRDVRAHRHDHLPERLTAHLTAQLHAEARRHPLGVVCSEPGWVRPLDATLVALALERTGGDASAWVRALDYQFALRRGHRPAWWWTPLGVAAGSMPSWEHAATTALARAAGWIDHDHDWTALRRATLGASARGTTVAADERLIAAGRIWALLADDAEAIRLLARPTIRHDALAVALDLVARRLGADTDSLHTIEGSLTS